MTTLEQIITDLKERGMKEKHLWIIKIDNKPIRLKSKIAWKKIGHAKSALRNYLYDVKYDIKNTHDAKDAYESLLASGRVDFVVVDLI